jgi:hypothetical protein
MLRVWIASSTFGSTFTIADLQLLFLEAERRRACVRAAYGSLAVTPPGVSAPGGPALLDVLAGDCGGQNSAV